MCQQERCPTAQEKDKLTVAVCWKYILSILGIKIVSSFVNRRDSFEAKHLLSPKLEYKLDQVNCENSAHPCLCPNYACLSNVMRMTQMAE